MKRQQQQRRRNIALSAQVHAFLDEWQARDRDASLDGNAPISELVTRLIEESAEYLAYEIGGVLPDVRRPR